MSLKICHAGAAGYAPANTLSSIQKALDLEVDMIEFDVHSCATGEIVLIHDEDVSITTDGKGLVHSMSFDELRKLKVAGAETIPTLQEALDLIGQKTEVNIEIKSRHAVGGVYKIIKQYIEEKHWSKDIFLISSFDPDALDDFRVLERGIRSGYLIKFPVRRSLNRAKKLNAYSINVQYPALNEKFIRLAHKRGLKVFAFTVNEPEDIRDLIFFGVDGIFSDFPDRIPSD